MLDRLRFLPVLLFLMALTTLACGLGGGTEPEATAPVTVPTDPAVVTTIIVVATPTLAEEVPAAADVPTLSAPTAQPGSPTMTALVSLNVRTGPGTNYPIVGAFGACLLYTSLRADEWLPGSGRDAEKRAITG